MAGGAQCASAVFGTIGRRNARGLRGGGGLGGGRRFGTVASGWCKRVESRERKATEGV